MEVKFNFYKEQSTFDSIPEDKLKGTVSFVDSTKRIYLSKTVYTQVAESLTLAEVQNLINEAVKDISAIKKTANDADNRSKSNYTKIGNLIISSVSFNTEHGIKVTFADGTVKETGKLPYLTQSEINNLISDIVKSSLSSVMTYKGTKPSKSSLPSSNNLVGDVWNVTDTDDNYAWNGSTWDRLSGTIDVTAKVNEVLNTKNYATKSYVDTAISEVSGGGITSNEVNNIVDGKLTDYVKLSVYNAKVQELQNKIDALTSKLTTVSNKLETVSNSVTTINNSLSDIPVWE